MNTSENPTESLRNLRKGLLDLHRELINSERVVFERSAGAIPSSAALLDLLANDPWFEWLRPLSQRIAAIDSALEDRETPVTAAVHQEHLEAVRRIATPDEFSSGAARNHFDAIQRDPEVAIAHARLRQLP